MLVIYDVGAHEGEDTDFYLKKGFKVVAVEANPTLARAMLARFSESIAAGQLTIVQAAVAEEDGEVEFFVNELSVWGTTREAWAERNRKLGRQSTRIRVPAISFGRLLEQHGVPYYLKIDIEGADMLCLRALAKTWIRPQFVSIESTKTSWRGLVAEFDVLRQLGYNRFKVIDQAMVQQQREPDPVREGVFANHRFPPHGSGLFGDDLPGAWLTRRQALMRYAVIFLRYRLFGDNTLGKKIARRMPARLRRRLIPGWFDTHATRGP